MIQYFILLHIQFTAFKNEISFRFTLNIFVRRVTGKNIANAGRLQKVIKEIRLTHITGILVQSKWLTCLRYHYIYYLLNTYQEDIGLVSLVAHFRTLHTYKCGGCCTRGPRGRVGRGQTTARGHQYTYIARADVFKDIVKCANLKGGNRVSLSLSLYCAKRKALGFWYSVVQGNVQTHRCSVVIQTESNRRRKEREREV